MINLRNYKSWRNNEIAQLQLRISIKKYIEKLFLCATCAQTRFFATVNNSAM